MINEDDGGDQVQGKTKYLVIFLLIIFFVSECEKAYVSAPPMLQYNGTCYNCTGGFIDSPAIRKEYIGEVESQVPCYEYPKQDFETNCDGLLGGKMYLLENGDIIVEYDGDAYGDWSHFSAKEQDFE